MAKNSFYLMLTLTVIMMSYFIVTAKESNSEDGLTIKPSEYCKHNGPTLSCSFKSTRHTVYMNTTLEAYLKKIFISGASKFIINASVCANVSLTDVPEAKVIGIIEDTHVSKNCPHMGIWLNNSTLDRLPPATTRLYVEKSRLGQLIMDEIHGSMTLISSSFDHVELRKPVINHTVQFFNSKIRHLKRLELATGSKLYLQNTVMQSISRKALVVGRDASVIFAGDQNLKFLDGELILQPGSYVNVNELSSNLNVKVLQETSQECVCEFQCKTYFYTIVVLTGIILLSLLVIIYLVISVRKLKQIHKRKLDNKAGILREKPKESNCVAEVESLLYEPRTYPNIKQTGNEETNLLNRIIDPIVGFFAGERVLDEQQTCNNKTLTTLAAEELTAASATPLVQKSWEQETTVKACNKVSSQRLSVPTHEHVHTGSHSCVADTAKCPINDSPAFTDIYTCNEGVKTNVQHSLEIKGSQKTVDKKVSIFYKAKEAFADVVFPRVEPGVSDKSNRSPQKYPFSDSNLIL